MDNQHKWQGRDILDKDHVKDLDLAAAIHEFHNGKPRKVAEDLAYSDYIRAHHTKAAAHHLVGMKAANAAGAMGDAKKHYDWYIAHLKSLGHEAHEAVPQEVSKEAQRMSQEDPVYIFRGHKADGLVS